MKSWNRYQFSAAMRLENYEGICARFHGYDFELTLHFERDFATATDTHLDLDFAVVDAFVADKIVQPLHDSDLGQTVVEPTLERVACWIGTLVFNEYPQLESIELSAGGKYGVEFARSEVLKA